MGFVVTKTVRAMLGREQYGLCFDEDITDYVITRTVRALL